MRKALSKRILVVASALEKCSSWKATEIGKTFSSDSPEVKKTRDQLKKLYQQAQTDDSEAFEKKINALSKKLVKQLSGSK